MKHLRKALALFLALTVIFAYSAVGAFAANGDFLDEPETTITATNLTAGDSIGYFQLVGWDDSVGNWALTTNGTSCGVTLDNLLDGITEAEAATIAGNLTGAGTAMTVSGTTATATVAPGLYFLRAASADNNTIYNPAFVSADYYEGGNTIDLESAYGSSSVLKKSPVPFDKDVVGADKYTDTKPGDVIPFKITTTVPSYGSSFTHPVFTITDTLSAGLTLEGDVTVKYGTADPTTQTITDVVTITKGTPSNGFTVKFEEAYLLGLKGATPVVEITYSAKVTTEAANNVTYMDNKAKLTYSNKPDETADKEDITRHYTFSIDGNLLGGGSEKTKELIKTGTDKNGQPITTEVEYYNSKKAAPLDGAQFTLYAADGTTVIATSNSAGGGYITFNGLDAGTYKLKETQAPAGYIGDPRTYTVVITPTYNETITDLLDSYTITFSAEAQGNLPAVNASASFTMDNDGGVTEASSTGTDTAFINNTQGAELPTTGGIGTTIFYILGIILVLGAGILLISRRRMHAR